VSLWTWLVERTRGASRAPDDLALGAVRPGDFADDPETPEHEGEGLAPNPHDPRDYQGRLSEQEEEELAARTRDHSEKEDSGPS